jgi:thymidine kinase
MATAEYVTKVHAICTRTGELAHFSYRKKPVKDQIFLGEKEEYEPLSRRAFIEARKKEQN